MNPAAPVTKVRALLSTPMIDDCGTQPASSRAVAKVCEVTEASRSTRAVAESS